MLPGDAEIAVSSASLLTHAGHVEASADGMEVASAAAVQLRLDTAAYGIICTFVPGFLNGLSDELVAGLDGAVASLRDTSSRLRATAALFDDANARAARQVLGGPHDGTGYLDRTSLLDPNARTQ